MAHDFAGPHYLIDGIMEKRNSISLDKYGALSRSVQPPILALDSTGLTRGQTETDFTPCLFP